MSDWHNWVLAAIVLAPSLAVLHYAGKLITRATGRARGGMVNLRSAITFLSVMVGGAALVSVALPPHTPLIYGAYGVVAGVASLVSQLLFGSPESNATEPPKGSR